MTDRIIIKNWYQLDFNISSPRTTLGNISELIRELKEKKLTDKWFYLFEGKTIRVRLASTNPTKLGRSINSTVPKIGLTIPPEHPFEEYWESTGAFTNVLMATTFANVMSALTEFTITRTDGATFSNYKIAERLCHCIFNNVYGSETETYFTLKRLKADFQLDDNPEQTALDDNQHYQRTSPFTLSFGSIDVPVHSKP